MNCKPGDLCFVVRPLSWTFWLTGEQSVCVKAGTIVRVVEINEFGNWQLQDPIAYEFTSSRGDFVAALIVGIGDEHLKPIPDIDEDAVDEMVQRLGSPRLEEVPCQ
jgi:hypothetical protein